MRTGTMVGCPTLIHSEARKRVADYRVGNLLKSQGRLESCNASNCLTRTFGIGRRNCDAHGGDTYHQV